MKNVKKEQHGNSYK
jgi:Ran GTPase-activating protein (RanGAP) involved in mRNA processing and transport